MLTMSSLTVENWPSRALACLFHLTPELFRYAFDQGVGALTPPHLLAV